MKLRDLLQQLQSVQKRIGASPPMICGGTPRDKYLNQLEKVDDIDITTGDKTIDYLSQQFALVLNKKYKINRKVMDDGHSSIYIGDLKLDFSSNFIVPGIDSYLAKFGIINPTDMQKEMFSRDFTCNALLLSMDLKNITDPTGMGFKDIKEKKVKTCLSPDVTLTAHKNRAIRAIYIASKLGFDIDPSIIEFIKKNPQLVTDISASQVSKKLNKAFAWDADRAAYNLTKMNLWSYIPVTEEIYPYYIKHVKKASADNKTRIVNHVGKEFSRYLVVWKNIYGGTIESLVWAPTGFLPGNVNSWGSFIQTKGDVFNGVLDVFNVEFDEKSNSLIPTTSVLNKMNDKAPISGVDIIDDSDSSIDYDFLSYDRLNENSPFLLDLYMKSDGSKDLSALTLNEADIAANEIKGSLPNIFIHDNGDGTYAIAKLYLEKEAYFQGGGGVNEPTPKKKKYKSEPALVNQPRFKEPLYDNYDLYETEGVKGPAKHSPGTGFYQNMEKYKSVSDFIKKKRKRNNGKYVAEDSYIQDDGSITKTKGKKKVAYFLGGGGVNDPTPKKPKYIPDPAIIIESRLPFYDNYNTYDAEGVNRPEQNGPVAGFYQNMSKVNGVSDFIEGKHRDRNRYIIDNNFVTKPSAKHNKRARRRAIIWGIIKQANDENNIDFPSDSLDSTPMAWSPGVGDAAQIGGYLDKYLPEDDFEGKPPTALDFGRDYAGPPLDMEEYISDLLEQFEKHVKIPKSQEPDLFGLPDGISPKSDLDSPSEEDPEYGIMDSGTEIYNKMWI